MAAALEAAAQPARATPPRRPVGVVASRTPDAFISRRAATAEERYYVVMGYFAELLWEVGAAEESLAALRKILTAASARSQNDCSTDPTVAKAGRPDRRFS